MTPLIGSTVANPERGALKVRVPFVTEMMQVSKLIVGSGCMLGCVDSVGVSEDRFKFPSPVEYAGVPETHWSCAGLCEDSACKAGADGGKV
jgi:hypothetical protein